MTERGSFVTEYIYCPTCFNHVKEFAFTHPELGKFWWPNIITAWNTAETLYRGVDSSSPHFESYALLPIIAGKIGGMGYGDEIAMFEIMAQELSEIICHPLRVVIIGDSGYTALCYIKPNDDPVIVQLTKEERQDEC